VNALSLRIDLHVHTCYSKDCATTLDEVILHTKKMGLSGIAITDHDTVEGASKLIKNRTGPIVIPGIEVSTNQGHIIGLNITTSIPPQLTIKETVERIHDVGGIAIVAHPSAILKDGIIGISLGWKDASYGLDAVEVVNSSVFPFFLNSLSKRLAVRMDLPQTAGSDSHFAETIGLAYTIFGHIGPEPNVEDIIEAVKKGMTRPYGKPIPWRLRLRKIFQK